MGNLGVNCFTIMEQNGGVALSVLPRGVQRITARKQTAAPACDLVLSE
jgi:hypothetical protein